MLVKPKRLLALVAGTVALAIATCAPVDTHDAKQSAAPTPTPAEAGPLPAPPAARPNVLKVRLEAAIKQAENRELRTDNGFWTVFHGILGLGPSVTLVDPKTRKRVNALDYIAGGGTLRGLRFVPTRDGLDVESAPGTFVSQGHNDQFVAEMVQWGVDPKKTFVVRGKKYTFQDFLNQTKARVSVKVPEELEWALVIIAEHFGTDVRWKNSAGEELRFEDLLRQELGKPVTGAACGGTHLLFGLTWAYHLHLRRGGKATGVWLEVADRIAEYKTLARKYQGPDGSFSTDFFRSRGKAQGMQPRIYTTGHVFEWLALALSDAELNEPWVQDAANALAMMFLEIQGAPMEGGAFYHAVHGLLIYYARVFGPEKLGPRAPHVPLLPAGPQGGGQGKGPR